jgi:DNA-binding NarL/FixJ family response regulator
VSNDNHRVRILIADEQALFREAVRRVLESESDLEVVAEAGSGFLAVAEAERTLPDVVIVDSHLSGGGGIQVTREIRGRAPGSRVLVLSAEDHQRVLIEAVEAGANGYLTKESALSELIDAARAVVRGDTVVPPRMLGLLLTGLMRRRRDHDAALERISRLTRRELQVLRLLVEGADNDGIARGLLISPQTARTHVQNILAKLQVHSRLEAAAFVTQQGLLEHLLPDGAVDGHDATGTERKWRESDLQAAR